MRFPFILVLSATAMALLGSSNGAVAQVNSDVGFSAGVMKRFTTSAAPGVSQPGFGPVVDLRGHLAVLPMLRVGLYVAYDHSPMPGAGDRNFLTGGIHVKVTPPLLPFPWKTYLFTGFGVGYAEADAYATTVTVYDNLATGASAPSGSVAARAPSLTGGLLEVPLGLGLARKLGTSWEVFLELGGRFGVATFGPLYDSHETPAYSVTGTLPAGSILSSPHAPFTGADSFALSLSVGVSLTH